MVKDLLANAEDTGDVGSIPESERYPGGGNDTPLQYSCLKNSMDRGAWWTTVHGAERVRHNWVTEHKHRFKKKKKNLKSVQRHRRPQIAKAILKEKNGGGGIRLSDFRVYCKAIVTKTKWY